MKLLVTGGAGFIGSYYIYHVLKNDPEIQVVNVDSLTYAGNQSNLNPIFQDELDSRYKFYHVDITDLEMMEHILTNEKPDWVINFAAESHVSRAAWGASPFIRTNIMGVYYLLTLCHKYGIKFFQISTDEVYGSIAEGEVDETEALKPTNLYSASKAAADLFCHAFAVTWNVPVWISRSVNNFGPNQHPEKLIPLAISNLLEDKTVPLHGGGIHVRPWIHVMDNATAIETIRRKGSPGIYNISCGEYYSVKEIVTKICEALGKDPRRYMEIQCDRPGNDFRYGITNRRIKELGWESQYTIQNKLEEVIQWYMDNKAWWRQIKATLGWQDYYKKIHLTGASDEARK